MHQRRASAQGRILQPGGARGRYPHEAFSGMRSVSSSPCPMIANPAVLLADDATLGSMRQCRRQASTISFAVRGRRGLAVMLITHDSRHRRHYCDRIAVMRDGKLIEAGEVSQFLREPRQSYSRKLGRGRPRPADCQGGQPIEDTRNLSTCAI